MSFIVINAGPTKNNKPRILRIEVDESNAQVINVERLSEFRDNIIPVTVETFNQLLSRQTPFDLSVLRENADRQTNKQC